MIDMYIKHFKNTLLYVIRYFIDSRKILQYVQISIAVKNLQLKKVDTNVIRGSTVLTSHNEKNNNVLT